MERTFLGDVCQSEFGHKRGFESAGSILRTTQPELIVAAVVEGQLLYERRNGNFILRITGRPQFGVPFGQDRMVPIFLATLAVRQKSQTIRFSSVSEMLETFGMQKVALSTVGRLPAFERISGATMFFGTESGTAKARIVQ